MVGILWLKHKDVRMAQHQNILQDTMEFVIVAENTVVNDTVKLVANISAMIAGDTTEDDLRTDIKATMKKLIDVDWQFSNMTREADDSGLERVNVTASIRVKETENYNLEDRTKAASRKGLMITSVEVDTSVPQVMIDAAESDLRATLVTKAKEECQKLSAAMQDTYRVHSLRFSPVNNNVSLRAISNASITASATKMAYGSGFSNDEDSLGNASKLTMQATITLARVVGNPDLDVELAARRLSEKVQAPRGAISVAAYYGNPLPEIVVCYDAQYAAAVRDLPEWFEGYAVTVTPRKAFFAST